MTFLNILTGPSMEGQKKLPGFFNKIILVCVFKINQTLWVWNNISVR